MKVRSESEVVQSCPTLCNPMDCRLPGSFIHGIFQARVLEWGANKILKEMGIPDHLTCLLRNLYADQEATVRTGHGVTDWFQIGRGVCQGYILSPCLFNLYAKYIMRNVGLEEAQAGIKIVGRSINNLRYVDNTTLKAESEEEPKSLLMKTKEGSEQVFLKLNIQKTKIMASGPITSWQIDGETVETVADFILGSSKITADGDSVQFSRSVVSNSLRPRESQHARPPCPSPSPGVHSNSRP